MIYVEIGFLLITLLLGVVSSFRKSSRVDWKRFTLEVSLELLFLLAGVPESVEFYAEEQVQHRAIEESARHPVERVDFYL